MAGRVTTCRAGQADSRVAGFLGLWPEHFTTMENSRSLCEPLHSIPGPTLGLKKKKKSNLEGSSKKPKGQRDHLRA